VINFTRAFDSAWERMSIILFRPFDLGKWFVIGFGAFLAGLLSGGNGFNSSYNQNSGNGHPFNFSAQQQQQNLSNAMSRLVTALHSFQTDVVIVFVVLVFVFVLAFVILLYWLGARGQFIFIDNIVRNRAAIAEPWSRYARQGNGVFFFYLILMGISLVVFLFLGGIALLLGWSSLMSHTWPTGPALEGLVALGLIYLLLCLALACFLFLFREWGMPLMFRNNLGVGAALGETWKLITAYPGTAILFVLLRIALWLALVILSIVACCFTCCIAALPYLGTVVLLPALIYIKCFSLDVLAQFGPEYDVFTVDVPPSAPATLSPPPPLG
jgi:hypothetical protein